MKTLPIFGIFSEDGASNGERGGLDHAKSKGCEEE